LVEKAEKDFMNTGNEHIKIEKKKEVGIIMLNRPDAAECPGNKDTAGTWRLSG